MIALVRLLVDGAAAAAAGSMGLRTVAEGVEEIEQLDHDCDVARGVPVRAADATLRGAGLAAGLPGAAAGTR